MILLQVMSMCAVQKLVSRFELNDKQEGVHMATVKLGRELREQIITSAYNKFSKQVEEAERIDLGAHWGDYIYETIFGEYRDVLSAVPTQFLYTRSEIKVNKIGGIQCFLSFTLTNSEVMPFGSWDNELIRMDSYNNFELRQHTAWDELFYLFVAKRDKINAAQQRRSEFRDMVREVVNNHATLAAALRTWPPLWDIVPEWAKDKHREIKEKVKKDEPQLNVDLGRLTAMATAQKLIV
jgi:hypothetical protein